MEKDLNKQLGIAKRDLKIGDEITVVKLKDGRLYCEVVNFLESIKFEDLLWLK